MIARVVNYKPQKTMGCNYLLHTGGGGWSYFKNTYELLNLRARKFSLINQLHIFQCMGKIFPHKISYPYIERDYFFYSVLKFMSSDLRVRKSF